MLKSFTVNLAADPDVVLAQARKVAAQNGGTFKGDIHSGQFGMVPPVVILAELFVDA